MGLKTIEYVAAFDLNGEHSFAIKRLGGIFSDTLEVTIDQQQVLLTQVSSWKPGPHRHHCSVGQHPVEIVWKWGFHGDPLFIALKQGSRILALYGDEGLNEVATGANPAEPRKISALSIVRDELERLEIEQIAQEEFPLDNSSGSDVLSVEYEVSKSLNSSVTIANRQQVESNVKGSLLTVLESQLAAHLSRVTTHTIGETTTRRQQLKFSVKPGEAVIYTVIWKRTTRDGICHFSVDGLAIGVRYSVGYGLSFEIGSKPLEGQPVPVNLNADSRGEPLPPQPNSFIERA